MRNAPIVQGVPTPYALHVHPYPTRFHGPIYTRPVFGAPVIARPQDVFTPGYNIDREVAQPTLSGLGATVGDGMLWDTGNGVFRPGGYGGGVFDGDIAGLGSLAQRQKTKRRPGRWFIKGLGDDAADYPWRVKSDKTAALQTATNVSLKKAGMCPITVDGKLGGATCGARNYLTVNSQQIFGQEMSFANPSACDAHSGELVRPKSSASGCGAGGAAPALPGEPPIVEAGMSSSTKRALGFAVGGILAIGAVVMLRKKR